MWDVAPHLSRVGDLEAANFFALANQLLKVHKRLPVGVHSGEGSGESGVLLPPAAVIKGCRSPALGPAPAHTGPVLHDRLHLPSVTHHGKVRRCHKGQQVTLYRMVQPHAHTRTHVCTLNCTHRCGTHYCHHFLIHYLQE